MMYLKAVGMNDERKTDITRRDKPWPALMDYIFQANMNDGTVRMVGSILVFRGGVRHPFLVARLTISNVRFVDPRPNPDCRLSTRSRRSKPDETDVRKRPTRYRPNPVTRTAVRFSLKWSFAAALSTSDRGASGPPRGDIRDIGRRLAAQ